MAGQDHLIPKKNCVFGTNTFHDEVRGCSCLNSEKVKWFFPFFFAGLGWYCQSVGLHWATYQYIHKYAIDSKTLAADKDYRTLYDSLEPSSPEQIDMKTIDKVASMIPVCFMVLTLLAVNPLSTIQNCWGRHVQGRKKTSTGKLHDHPEHPYLLRQNVLRIWTKVMTCAMFLFMCKGTLGAITVVPDSSGWNVCKNRLKTLGTEWMRQDHTFSDMLSIDVIWVSEHHAPLRYCADMMFSGHTFVVTLFALGTYEMMRTFRLENFGGQWSRDHKRCVKISVLSIWAAFIIAEQLVEITYVERSHFHYSMDVFMAVIITFLFYTNGVIAVFAKLWATWGLSLLDPRNLSIRKSKVQKQNEDTQNRNATDLPTQEMRLKDVWALKAVPMDDDDVWTDPKKQQWALLNSRGDIFIPPCCFPFCLLSGREHVYSDAGIRTIIQEYVPDESEAIHKYLQETMMLEDGVMLKDVPKMV